MGAAPQGGNRIYGVHAGYDGRTYACDNPMICGAATYHWLNGGVETLGTDWDARANVYGSPGRRDRHYDLESVGFAGNALLVAPFYTEAMRGFDVLDDLIASGHLDPAIRDKMQTFSIARQGAFMAEWTPETADFEEQLSNFDAVAVTARCTSYTR